MSASQLLAGFVIALLVLMEPAAHAQNPAPLRANIEYRVIPQQPVATGERIEVIDFFWYGCPYCNELQPALEEWIRRKPADVALRRIPAIRPGRDAWAPHARIYYTLEALDEVERLHLEVYHGYHVEQLHMSKPDVMEQWAVRHGIPRDRWAAAYGSAETDRKVERAKELTRLYDVPGTPTLVVDGRYLTSGSMAETIGGLIPILDQLIGKARADRGNKAQ